MKGRSAKSMRRHRRGRRRIGNGRAGDAPCEVVASSNEADRDAAPESDVAESATPKGAGDRAAGDPAHLPEIARELAASSAPRIAAHDADVALIQQARSSAADVPAVEALKSGLFEHANA